VLSKSVGRVSRDSLRISSVDETAGWHSEPDRVPAVGEMVLCVEGEGEVVGVLGKISDGSRLLQIRMDDRTSPFFASSSNVLVQTDSAGGS
jgi:hypothetical protein